MQQGCLAGGAHNRGLGAEVVRYYLPGRVVVTMAAVRLLGTLLAVAPALSAYLHPSARRSRLDHTRMSAVDGESMAPLPAGLEKQVLRSALPSAKRCKTGDIALVHFTVSKADGTLLHDSRADDGKPLEFSVGVQPSEVALGWDLAMPGMRVGEVA